MNVKLKVQTPKGAFGVLTNQVRSGSYAAAVVYQPGDHKDRIEHHVENGDTEQQALEYLRCWCEKTFGRPCQID